MKKTLFIGIMLSLVLGCTTTTPQQNSLLQNQVFSLRQVQKKQSETQKKIQDQIAALEKRIQELSQRPAGDRAEDSQAVSQSVLSKQADLASKVESQQIKLATLMGSQEELERSVKEVRETGLNNEEQLKSLEKRLSRLETELHQIVSQLGIDTTERSAQEVPKPKTEKETQEPEKSQKITPEFLYDQGLQAFNQRDYTKALGLWSDMVDSFPEHELTPNAYFWQGEAYYQMQDFAKAALQYNRVIEQFPESNKYPAALLKQGLSYYALDKNKAGRLRLEELIQKFPNRAEAKRAQIFLNNR
jgi:tol-pal system protein YbgF